MCCGFSPYSADIIFAGTQAGSVLLWDLREFSLWHGVEGNLVENFYLLEVVDGHHREVRNPTYSTDGLFRDNHQGKVVRIGPVSSATAERSRMAEDDTSEARNSSAEIFRPKIIPDCVIGRVFCAEGLDSGRGHEYGPVRSLRPDSF